VTPNEFVPGKARPPGAPAALLSTQLPSSGLIDLAVEPRGAEDAAVAVLDEIRGFPAPVEFQDSALLAPLPSAIEFPAEDADVTLESAASRVASFGPSEETSTGETAVEATEPSEPASPSATLEALARLHEELLEQHEADAQSAQAAIIQTEPVEQIVAEPREETSAIEPVQADPVAMESPMATTAETEDQPQPAVESSPETATVKPQAERGTPQGTGEFVEVPVKSYPPPKPALMEGVGPLFHAPAILPRLTGLPLRPKIGLASPQTAQSLSASQSKNAPAEARSKGPATRDSGATEVPEKAPAKIEKPAVPARTAPVAKSEPAKPATSSAWQKPQPAPVAKTTKSDTDDTARPVPVPARQPNGLKQAEASAKPKVPEKTRTADKPEPAEAKAPKTEAPPAEIRDNEAPIFGAGQLGNTSLMGSFKFKLAIGVVVVAILAVGYFVWGGKPAPSAVNPSPAAAKPGPSIMVGGGGWIEGWAGDPVGARLGRQITIYRPSLKLADYRIDFQGSIETKSMGWVFRATDPQNYYAMKLSYVTSGPEPKIALFKYLVAEGHQTQVGRVPIDLAVHLDTQYTVRVDVQGPRFVTYLQGQQVDIWTDDQLKTGAVGFLNEREERARVKSVSVSLLNGARQGAGQ